MPFRLNKKPARGSIGLDIDGSHVAAVQVSGGAVTRAASMDLTPGLMSEGEVVDVDGLADALKLFFERNALPRSARLGVANHQIAVRQMQLPRIEDDAERDAAVRFQAAEMIPMPLDEVVLDYQVVGESNGGEAVQTDVVVVAARQSMVTKLIEATRAAGVKALGVDLNAFALIRVLSPGDDEEAPEPSPDAPARVHCHLGGVTNLAVATGRTCLFTRPLSSVWDAQGDDTASALAEEIRLSIDFYMAQEGARPAGEIVLSGPGASDAALVSELDALLTLPVTVADPLGELVDALPAEEDPYVHTVAAGLALGQPA